jgi:6-phosphogluconolactonase
MNRLESRLGILALLALGACGGGGGGGTSATAPSNLLYPRTALAFLTDVPATPDTPTYSGSPSTFTILPALPAGLTLGTSTGTIGGVATAASPQASYVVKAANSAGFTTTTIQLGVSLAPRFAYVANQNDSTITILREDATNGALNQVGYFLSPASQSGPERVAVHPGGRYVYVPNMDTSNLSVYTVDASDGWLTAGTPVPLGSGPHNLTIDPSGTYVYVTSQNSNQLQVYSISPANGALSLVQSISTGVQPSACAIDAQGRFLFVTLHGNPSTGAGSAMQSYLIDAPTGSVTAPTPAASLNGSQPTDVVVDPNGNTVYTTGERFDLVIPVSYDGTTGALTVLTARHSGSRPTAVAMEPTGRFVYVTNLVDSTITTYLADSSTGDLTAVGTVPTGASPTAVLADPAARYVYVVSSGDQTVAQFAIDDVTGALTQGEGIATRSTPASIGLAKGPTKLAVVPRFVHVAAASSDEVPAYTIDGTTGELSELPNPALTQSRPVSVAVDARHRFLYAAVQTGQAIDTFTVNPATGALASVGLPAPVTGKPTHVTVDPSGRFLYATVKDVAAANDGWVTSWTISQNDGSLTPLDTHQVADLALWCLCDSTGTFLYVASRTTVTGGAKISVLRINPADGTLTPSANPPASASGVVALGYHPKKRALYSVLATANAIVTFTADAASGELTVVPGGAGNSGISPSAISLTPNGKFAYVSYLDPAGTGHVSQFAVDATTGKLIVPAVQYQDGLHPTDLGVEASGRFLYVANSGSNTVSVFQIDAATGALTTATAAASGLEPNGLCLSNDTQ